MHVAAHELKSAVTTIKSSLQLAMVQRLGRGVAYHVLVKSICECWITRGHQVQGLRYPQIELLLNERWPIAAFSSSIQEEMFTSYWIAAW